MDIFVGPLFSLPHQEKDVSLHREGGIFIKFKDFGLLWLSSLKGERVWEEKTWGRKLGGRSGKNSLLILEPW